jgi:triphosphatase
MVHEVELKLTLPPGAADGIAAAPLLAQAVARRVALDAIYYDTGDRLLQRHGMALRLRRTGRSWVQTLKTTSAVRTGRPARPEFDMPPRMLRGQPTLNLARLASTPAGNLVAGLSARPKLAPQFRVRVQRQIWELRHGQSDIEVALDRGRIEASRDGRRVTTPVSEIELELKSGRAEDLIAAALRLIGSGRDALGLVPSVRGKAERGYLLAAGKAPAVAKAVARGFAQTLKPSTSTAAALRAVMSHGLTLLLANTEGLQAVHQPEYVHQARVALRRMRSALRLFDRAHADFPQALGVDLQWVGRLLGEARDADVLADTTLPALLAAAPPELAEHLGDLRQRVDAARVAARERALAGLATARYARLALRLHAWTLSPPPASKSLAKTAPRQLERARARLFESAQFFVALPAEQRHAARIHAKRLRYALDLYSVALPAEAAALVTSALAKLQDVLGELNDGAVALTALPTFGAAPQLVDWMAARIEAQELPLAVESERRLLALHGIAPPWR